MNKTMIVVNEAKAQSNNTEALLTEMQSYSHEETDTMLVLQETDTMLVLHVLDTIRETTVKQAGVSSSDTEMFLLLRDPVDNNRRGAMTQL